MGKSLSEVLHQDCLYKTNRISILNWSFVESHEELKEHRIECVLNIMTPNVTKSLPDGWQNLNTIDKAEEWIDDRKNDSYFYAITLTESQEIIGFLFLYATDGIQELRLGYLLGESVWGQGIGSELVKGLVEWSRNTGIVNSISGGVEKDNIGSIKVLEKSGFYKSNEKLPGEMLLYKIDLKSKTE